MQNDKTVTPDQINIIQAKNGLPLIDHRIFEDNHILDISIVPGHATYNKRVNKALERLKRIIKQSAVAEEL